MTVHGIQSDQAPLKRQFIDQSPGGRNFIALFSNLQMPQDQRVIDGKSVQHMRRLLVVEGIKTAPQGFTVNRHNRHLIHVPARPAGVQLRPILTKDTLHRVTIEPLQDEADGAVCRGLLPSEPKRLVQTRAVCFDETMNLAIRCGPGQYRQDCRQKHWGELPLLALTAPRIRHLA